ncbi:hypothetical protein [Pontibacter vulgaris]|uniref:hypothetical protein n=1 Tax=Pontibacter vulgaris TaxID=2905679 RepID=UPI001FA7313B|nr:hypothetical protein [Pontibacter vulgaris]
MSHHDFISISLDHGNSLAIIRWLRQVEAKEYRCGVLKSGRIIINTKVERLLVNSLKLGVPTLQDQNWVAEKLKEIFDRSNIRRVARVVFPEIFFQIASERIFKTLTIPGSNYEIETFTSEEEAMEWLLNDIQTTELFEQV